MHTLLIVSRKQIFWKISYKFLKKAYMGLNKLLAQFLGFTSWFSPKYSVPGMLVTEVGFIYIVLLPSKTNSWRSNTLTVVLNFKNWI